MTDIQMILAAAVMFALGGIAGMVFVAWQTAYIVRQRDSLLRGLEGVQVSLSHGGRVDKKGLVARIDRVIADAMGE